MRRAFVGLFILCVSSCSISHPTPPDPQPQPKQITDPNPGPDPVPGQDCSHHDSPIDPSGRDLAVPFAYQQCTEWCWAGALTMVGNYYGKTPMECEFVSAKTGLPCCSYGACNYPQCNTVGTGSDIAILLSRIGVHGVALQRALNENELQIELSNDRPVIVNYYNSFNGHYAVLSGFRKNAQGAVYHVMDPWPDFGQFWTTYQNIKNGPQGNTPWSYTFYHLETHVDNCGP